MTQGEMAEWSIAAVLKTVELRGSGGSNPSLSAIKGVNQQVMRFTPFSTPQNLRETIFTDCIEYLKGFLFKIVDYRFQNLLENKNLWHTPHQYT